jgi:hypothetical protein
MMKEKLSPAVDALLDKLKEQQAAATATKKMINQLRLMMGEETLFADVEPENELVGAVRADQYYGKTPTAAAEEYLKRRNQACSPEEIYRGLEQGGFDFDSMDWKPKDRMRLLAITLAKNPQKFHKLPNNTFGLPIWYPGLTTKRADKAEKSANGVTTDEVVEIMMDQAPISLNKAVQQAEAQKAAKEKLG